MFSFAKDSIRQNVGVFIVVLGILVGGTWLAVKRATDHLLYKDATSTAHSWARFLAASVTDLEQIAAGEQPSAASMVFFQSAQKSGEVFRYEIFNPSGYAQLVSDRDKIALVDLSEYSADAARSLATGEPIVDVEAGNSAELPTFFARAYVPVLADGRPVAVVAAYVDQTEQHADFYNTFLTMAASLCLLTGLAFAIPAVAWYRRTKEKQQADRRIRFLAHHDALTGLANRPSLIDKLARALTAPQARGGSLAVHFVDLDRFKEVNDTLGHDGGDFLLKTVAERLCAAIRIDDVVARLGGDEFVVVQSGVHNEGQAKDFAQRIILALTAPIQFKGHDLRATVSIGVALAPGDGRNPERLLKCADLALYKSKADGRNCIRFFRPEMDTDLQAQIELERIIRDAVLHDRFELHYQPLFEISDRRLIGFEALIRLPKEDGTLIPPLVFIHVAENLRLIDKIGAWVLREACRTAATWPEHLTVAVNLSPAQFLAGSVSAIVAAALKEAGLAAHRLELEITETLLLGNSEAIMVELQTLKAMDVAIVMDDFGTGYSSLSYLWRFPFDKIKIDRSFMQGFDNSGRNAKTVVKTIIALGRELDMRVTVEGVETATQAAFLDKVHGDQAQGFFFGRPIPASEIAASFLADSKKTLTKPSSATEQETNRRLLKSLAGQRPSKNMTGSPPAAGPITRGPSSVASGGSSFNWAANRKRHARHSG
jgi:diguanylate cyclase (GGDEF)-like protein